MLLKGYKECFIGFQNRLPILKLMTIRLLSKILRKLGDPLANALKLNAPHAAGLKLPAVQTETLKEE